MNIAELVRNGDIHKFYVSPAWRKLRKQVLAMDKHECQECKKRGRYTKANHVHHVNHVDKFPSKALDIFYRDGGVLRRNLISVCKDCHETVCHPERLRHTENKPPLTVEKW